MKNLMRNLSNNKFYFFSSLIIGILFCINAILTPIYSGNLINAFTEKQNVMKMFIIYLCMGIMQFLFSMLDNIAKKKFSVNQKKIMRKNVFSSFLNKDTAGKEEISSITSFINNDIPTVSEQYFSGIIDIAECICMALFSALSILSINIFLAVIVSVFSILIISAPKLTQKYGAKARKEYSQSFKKYNTSLNSFFPGIKIIKSYNYRKKANEIQEDFNSEVSKKELKNFKYEFEIRSITAFLEIGKTLSLFIIGAYLVYVDKITIGGLIAAVQISEIIAGPLEVLAYLIHGLNEVKPILHEYELIVYTKNTTNKAMISELGDISVNNLTYEINNIKIIDNVSAKFEAGKKYLITGESGSGKSTLLRLIANIDANDYNGEILFGKQNLKYADMDSYYKFVCPVFQEPYLFYTSLEENILMGCDNLKSKYEDVIDKLKLRQFVERYKDEEITPQIIEQMSGGEKQRVALARAILKKPKVYLLDEFTSALDKETSEMVEKIILNENATVIHICHKPNEKLLSLYDAHYVMKNGHLMQLDNLYTKQVLS